MTFENIRDIFFRFLRLAFEIKIVLVWKIRALEILFTIICQYICYIWVLCQMNRLFVQTFCFSLRKIKYEPGNASVRPRWCTQDFSPEAYLGPSCHFWRQKFPAKTWSGAPHMRIMRKQSLICNKCSFFRLKLTNCTFQLSELLRYIFEQKNRSILKVYQWQLT